MPKLKKSAASASSPARSAALGVSIIVPIVTRDAVPADGVDLGLDPAAREP